MSALSDCALTEYSLRQPCWNNHN